MHVIKKMALTPFSCLQMFELVNDVAKYAEFVPWCTQSKVLKEQENLMVAQLTFSQHSLSKSFTTRNTLSAPHKIEIGLDDGPFKHLLGHWSFTEVAENKTQVNLELEFEFINQWVSLMFGGLFQQVANRLVSVFCERAQVLYGQN